jgi:hypothetical protein
MTLNVISNVPDKKVIDPKPASKQGELDTPPMIKFARAGRCFFPDTQLSSVNRNDVYSLKYC